MILFKVRLITSSQNVGFHNQENQQCYQIASVCVVSSLDPLAHMHKIGNYQLAITFCGLYIALECSYWKSNSYLTA